MDSLKGILTVIAVGVPALLILLGFAAAVFGWMFGLVTNDTGMRNFGILLIIVGILLYILEIGLHYYNQQNSGSD